MSIICSLWPDLSLVCCLYRWCNWGSLIAGPLNWCYIFIYLKAVFPFLTTTTLCVPRSFIPLIGQCPVELTFEPQGTVYTSKKSFSQSFFSFWTGNRDMENWRGNFLCSFVGYSQKNKQPWICGAVSIMSLT